MCGFNFTRKRESFKLPCISFRVQLIIKSSPSFEKMLFEISFHFLLDINNMNIGILSNTNIGILSTLESIFSGFLVAH